jgi:F0F1-type ATP synthase alpha subunit
MLIDIIIIIFIIILPIYIFWEHNKLKQIVFKNLNRPTNNYIINFEKYKEFLEYNENQTFQILHQEHFLLYINENTTLSEEEEERFTNMYLELLSIFMGNQFEEFQKLYPSKEIYYQFLISRFKLKLKSIFKDKYNI